MHMELGAFLPDRQRYRLLSTLLPPTNYHTQYDPLEPGYCFLGIVKKTRKQTGEGFCYRPVCHTDTKQTT